MSDLRLHIGAHKTATTHLQDTLAALRPALAWVGCDYIPCDALRPPLHEALRRDRFRHRQRPSWLQRRQLRRVLADLRMGPEHVVASEENILGLCADALHSGLYPQAGARLRMFAGLGGGMRLHLFLSIRDFAGVLPGAYAEALRYPGIGPAQFAAARARIASSPPRWRDLIERVEAALPGVPLCLWRQEDYRDHTRAILEHFLGIPIPGELPDLPPPPRTQSPSVEAVAEAERRVATLSPGGLREDIVNQIYASLPAGPERPRFSPLNAVEKARLAAAYEEDLDWIARCRPGMLFQPGAARKGENGGNCEQGRAYASGAGY